MNPRKTHQYRYRKLCHFVYKNGIYSHLRIRENRTHRKKKKMFSKRIFRFGHPSDEMPF